MSQSSNYIKPMLQRLGSMSLAITLLTVLALASVIGTVLLQNQDQADYLQQFGPIWYWVFRALGLFDMYHTWWFLSLLGFLMLSLSVCLWRNVPRFLKEMRNKKVPISDSALKHMQHKKAWHIAEASVETIFSPIKAQLKEWHLREEKRGDTTYIRADKGSYHKWGYILVHSAMLLMLVGGWMSTQFGFRGNMSVPEGAKESEISFLKGTETAYLKMPFEVRCNQFSIDFYPNGMPKEFKSNLTIIDDGKEVLTSDIIVNEPLYYKGVRIYQASFGDGGSNIRLKLVKLDGSGEIETAHTKIYTTFKDEKTGVTLEMTDFRPHNVENMAEPNKPKDFQDLGASVDYVMRGPGLKPVKIRSFIEPFVLGGENRGNFLQVSFSGNTKEFQPMALGLDMTNAKEWELFQRFILRLADADLKKPQEANIRAFKLAMADVFGADRPDNFQAMAMRVLQAVQIIPQLPLPYIPVLDMTNAKERELFQRFILRLADADLKKPQEANMRAFKLAMADVFGADRPDNFQAMAMRVLQAVQIIPQLPWPYIPVLDDYDQKYYTGLQLAMDPGMNVIWIASALLTFGLCIMLYVAHRKLWIVVQPEGNGMKVTIAGLSNRNPLNFEREFHTILSNIENDTPHWKKGDQV